MRCIYKGDEPEGAGGMGAHKDDDVYYRTSEFYGKPELLFPFPWDEEREPIEIDENELKELRERAKNMEYGK